MDTEFPLSFEYEIQASSRVNSTVNPITRDTDGSEIRPRHFLVVSSAVHLETHKSHIKEEVRFKIACISRCEIRNERGLSRRWRAIEPPFHRRVTSPARRLDAAWRTRCGLGGTAGITRQR